MATSPVVPAPAGASGSAPTWTQTLGAWAPSRAVMAAITFGVTLWPTFFMGMSLPLAEVYAGVPVLDV